MAEEFDKKDKEIINETDARKVAMKMRQDFSRLVIADLKKTKSGAGLLKKYKQSEVRDIIENYTNIHSQHRLKEISNLLWAKSPQYQSLISYLSTMLLFYYVLTPKKDIRKISANKVKKEHSDMSEFLSTMKLKHEMTKVLATAFKDDVFYGYVHRDKESFHIQPMEFEICKITSIQDGVFNYSIDMKVFLGKPENLVGMPDEVVTKFREWEILYSKNRSVSNYVELDAKNTICIKINEDTMHIFPPYAGSFDAIFDIEGFKRLRKDKEELGNYMMLAQKVPIRTDTDDNNDFAIDEDTMMYFHRAVSETVPDNVGVITSPMPIEPIKFEKDRVDFDGVAKSERDFWGGAGTAIFNADKSTSQGLLMAIKTDEQIVFRAGEQIQRWINRYLSFHFKNSNFQAKILPITDYNKAEMYSMYLESATYGIPVKSHVGAIMGLEPIELTNMAYLENDILKLHDEFIPMQSSHTMTTDEGGAPKKDAKDKSDETVRAEDKTSTVVKK